MFVFTHSESIKILGYGLYVYGGDGEEGHCRTGGVSSSSLNPPPLTTCSDNHLTNCSRPSLSILLLHLRSEYGRSECHATRTGAQDPTARQRLPEEAREEEEEEEEHAEH
jgi:hypothetical protein